MTASEIIIILVCAGLGFGIVNSLINAARQPKDGPDPEDRGPSERL
jgi:hypothetical protein